MYKKIHELAVNFLKELDFREKRSHHTLKAYAGDLEQFFTDGQFTGPKIDDSTQYLFVTDSESSTCFLNCDETILHKEVSNFLHKISKLEPSSRGRKIATLKKFFRFLKSEGFISKIPAILVTPKQPTKIPNFISVDEVLSIMNSFKRGHGPRHLQKEVLFLLLYGAGLRVSEACELRWENVDILQRRLRIRGKGDKTRVISFPRYLQGKLSQLYKPQSYLWGKSPLNRRTAYNLIRECGAQAHLNKPLNPHALRHSFATHLLNDGADLRIIQELLGHSSLNATEKYTHISLDQLTQTMESFHPLAKKA